jgi:hypothetical protein
LASIHRIRQRRSKFETERSDVPAALRRDDGRTDVSPESNAMQHRIELVAKGDQVKERQI